MKLLSVTDLASYVYCSRALYMQKVLGIKEPIKPAMIKGAIRHKVYDELNCAEEKIILGVNEKTSKQELLNEYKKQFAGLLRSSILKRKEQITALGMLPRNLFLELWPYLLNESEERTESVFGFVKKERLFGEPLWINIEPKLVTELSVKSKELMLKGVIDKVEVYKDRCVPYELKTGAAPKDGLWPSHRIQLSAYMLLLKHKVDVDVSSGVVHYLDAKQKQELKMSPFMEEEIRQLTQKTADLLNSAEPPQISRNAKKCLSCGQRNICRNTALLQKMVKTKHLYS
jgi:CRISPR-associated protein Cas4